jgi:hypothetical protein
MGQPNHHQGGYRILWMRRAPGELKHLTTPRNRYYPRSSGERTGVSPNRAGAQAGRPCQHGVVSPISGGLPPTRIDQAESEDVWKASPQTVLDYPELRLYTRQSISLYEMSGAFVTILENLSKTSIVSVRNSVISHYEADALLSEVKMETHALLEGLHVFLCLFLFACNAPSAYTIRNR